MLKIFYDSLLTLIYPQTCHLCGNSVENSADGAACEKCWRKTRIFAGKEVLCAKCGAFLRDYHQSVETFCRRCDEHFYDAAKAAGIYGNALSASVVQLKKIPFVSARLKKVWLAAFENSDFHDADLIVPVPLSPTRRRERGFNQAEILGAFLSKKSRLKMDDKSFTRVVHTPIHRRAMDEKARQLSVKNAFRVTRPNFIEYRKILLVDDVFTSGATVSACAENLKKAGAEKVYVLTVARTDYQK